MAIKDRIKEARLNKKYTQEQLATKIGVAKSTVTGYEKGNSEPSLETICKLINVLDIDANYLWQDEMEFSVQISYAEREILRKYHGLDDHGREMVDFTLEKEWERSIKQKEYKKDNIVEFNSHVIPQAANPRTDINVTAEQIENDNNTMENPEDWKS